MRQMRQMRHMNQQVRFLSFRSLLSFSKESPDPKPIDVELVKGTGNGPFAETAKFEVIGTPASLLNIKLPASAILNIRYSNAISSVVGISGKLDNLTKELSLITSGISKPILYQRIYNTSPINLLVANSLNFRNFVVLNLKNNENENWVVSNSKNLIAWSGNYLNLKLNPKKIHGSSSNSYLSKFNALDVDGEGIIALAGNGQLFKVELNQDESIYINPSALVAHKVNIGNINDIKITKIPSKKLITDLNLSLPRFSIPDKLKLYYNQLYKFVTERLTPALTSSTTSGTTTSNINEVSETKRKPSEFDYSVSKNLSTVASSTKSVLTKLASFLPKIGKTDLLYEVKGPAVLIIQNDVSQGGDRVFTKAELDKVYTKMSL
ncbi:hypothetical protein PACTADRAFT_185603 [Pachysolen tannophilus NRRL Y-2460]|uniref:Altered inheritance of mitochondria protein 24, mitochondrial n=1 Tax=Pachysolen tannophilus NRRL Y-2460 TaxID=669874 RepID=A0A1E4U2A0_PACTA|nr:hypothetical protein PACTADRAFT_185603 [Pachysolen tannophilus NRRL Y-2460]